MSPVFAFHKHSKLLKRSVVHREVSKMYNQLVLPDVASASVSAACVVAWAWSTETVWTLTVRIVACALIRGVICVFAGCSCWYPSWWLESRHRAKAIVIHLTFSTVYIHRLHEFCGARKIWTRRSCQCVGIGCDCRLWFNLQYLCGFGAFRNVSACRSRDYLLFTCHHSDQEWHG